MKIFTTIFLTFCILVQTFSTFLIQADFYLNQSYIAENFCVNKDKPMMHCNGKCYLSKKLKEQQQDQQTPITKTLTFDIMPFYVPKLYDFEQIAAYSKTQYFVRDEHAISCFHSSIFHPPTV